MDIKKYGIPKEEYNIPTVNEGIQEGRKLIYCKDCKHWNNDGGWQDFNNNAVKICYGMHAYDFCSRGVKKDEQTIK